MTTKPTRRPTRRNIAFTVHEDGPIARIASMAGDPKLGDTISAMLDRYLDLIHRNAPKASARELCAIIDALGESWPGEPHQVHSLPRDVIPTIITDRLDTKWGADVQQLRSRLERTTSTDRTTLTEFCLAFWMMTSEDEAPQVTLDRVRQLLQSSTPMSDNPPRPRRISAVLFDQTESEEPPVATADSDAPLSSDPS